MAKLKVDYPKHLDCRRIVSFFFVRLSQITNYKFTPRSPNEWASFCGRVNGLKYREDISWEQYYNFIGFIFNTLVPSGYKPTFGMICSSRVWGLYKGFLKNEKLESEDQKSFEQLYKMLYSEKFLEILK